MLPPAPARRAFCWIQMIERSRHLRALLAAYVGADPLEASYVERMLGLAQSPLAFQRDAYAPGHFTASAFVLSPERDALLLILHRKLGFWLQPGGHVEAEDSTLLAAARREVAEEVGILQLQVPQEGIFDVDIHQIPAHHHDAAHEHHDVRFVFVAPTRHFHASPEVADCRWVSLSEIDQLTQDSSVLRAVRKLRARLRA